MVCFFLSLFLPSQWPEQSRFYINYFLLITGIEVYLLLSGGNECIISKEDDKWLLEIAARCLTKASQIINKKNSTEITEIMDPTLANTFQYEKKSG
jgi:hypothetical protein